MCFETSILISVTTWINHLFSGGLTAVIYTDTLSAFVMVLGALVVSIKGLWHVLKKWTSSWNNFTKFIDISCMDSKAKKTNKITSVHVVTHLKNAINDVPCTSVNTCMGIWFLLIGNLIAVFLDGVSV